MHGRKPLTDTPVLHPTTRHALRGMTLGDVDETWAREHHEYWYNQIKTGKVHPVTPAAGPTARPRVA